MKDPSGCFNDMYHLYSLSLPVALGEVHVEIAILAHLSIWSQPPRGPGRPTIARAHTAAYVGSKCAACPGPPPNPPFGCCHCMMVSIALSTEGTFIQIQLRLFRKKIHAPLLVVGIDGDLQRTQRL